ncbi:MAG: shikimate dehydrogenase [Chromatiales bacterium]|nr:shikimate dehydrogenase [Chromatiales bacterium]
MTGQGTDLYGVVGHPVGHSRSPLIHRLFAGQTGQDMDYVPIDAAPGQFEEVLAEFHRRGGRGLNITLPYKGDAYRFATRLTPRSETAQAVNTLCWRDDEVLGDNTDGAGLVTDLTANLGFTLSGRRVLLLGAGGAARGAIAPLLERSPAEVVIANRTVSRAQDLATRFSALGPVSAAGFDDLEGVFDLVINSTSASLTGEVPPLPVTSVSTDTLCYDMMYQKGPTAFLAWAGMRGACVIADGTGMLVEQAAESFFMWRGIRPDTGPVLRAVRSQLS